MRLRVRTLALLSGLRIQHCRELWCTSQTRLRSSVAMAVAQASGYSSDSTPSLGTSICRGSGPRNNKKTKKKKNDCVVKNSSHFRENDSPEDTRMVYFGSRNQIFERSEGVSFTNVMNCNTKYTYICTHKLLYTPPNHIK